MVFNELVDYLAASERSIMAVVIPWIRSDDFWGDSCCVCVWLRWWWFGGVLAEGGYKRDLLFDE